MKAFALAAMATVALYPAFTFAEEVSIEPIANLEDTMTVMPVNSIAVGEPMMCTMEYMPVCGINGTTYGNSCSAGKNAIAYEGECESYVNYPQYARLKRVAGKAITAKVSGYSEEARVKALETIEARIAAVKLSRIAPQAQKEKITFLVFVRGIIQNTLKY